MDINTILDIVQGYMPTVVAVVSVVVMVINCIGKINTAVTSLRSTQTTDIKEIKETLSCLATENQQLKAELIAITKQTAKVKNNEQNTNL